MSFGSSSEIEHHEVRSQQATSQLVLRRLESDELRIGERRRIRSQVARPRNLAPGGNVQGAAKDERWTRQEGSS